MSNNVELASLAPLLRRGALVGTTILPIAVGMQQKSNLTAYSRYVILPNRCAYNLLLLLVSTLRTLSKEWHLPQPDGGSSFVL